MWIGNDAYCRRFRNIAAYANEAVFARIIDFSIMDYIMSHMDSKLLLLQTGLIIVLDYGRAWVSIVLANHYKQDLPSNKNYMLGYGLQNKHATIESYEIYNIVLFSNEI